MFAQHTSGLNPELTLSCILIPANPVRGLVGYSKKNNTCESRRLFPSMFTPRSLIWCWMLVLHTHTHIWMFLYTWLLMYMYICWIYWYIYIDFFFIIYVCIYIYTHVCLVSTITIGWKNSMRRFSGALGCGYRVCQSKQLLRCFDNFRCLQHGWAGNGQLWYSFCSYALATFEYHPIFAELPWCEIWINKYL